MGQPAEAEAASLLDNNAAPPPQRTPRKAVVAGLALLAAVTAATARATRPAPRLASNAMDIAVTGPYGANTAAQYPFLASGRYDALVEPHASTELRVAGAPRSAASAVWTFGDGRAAPSGFAVNATFPALGEYRVSATAYDAGGRAVAAATALLVCRYARREIRQLTDGDRTRFLDAMQVLWSCRNCSDAYGPAYVDIYALTRQHAALAGDKACDHMHDGLGFLTMHLGLSLAFEQSIQAVDAAVALPYWDYTVDRYDADRGARPLGESAMWRSDWFGTEVVRHVAVLVDHDAEPVRAAVALAADRHDGPVGGAVVPAARVGLVGVAAVRKAPRVRAGPRREAPGRDAARARAGRRVAPRAGRRARRPPRRRRARRDGARGAEFQVARVARESKGVAARHGVAPGGAGGGVRDARLHAEVAAAPEEVRVGPGVEGAGRGLGGRGRVGGGRRGRRRRREEGERGGLARLERLDAPQQRRRRAVGRRARPRPRHVARVEVGQVARGRLRGARGSPTTRARARCRRRGARAWTTTWNSAMASGATRNSDDVRFDGAIGAGAASSGQRA